jgi:serine/threonine-protein kinase
MTPSNVFVTYEGIVKVVDFGIAKAAGRTTDTRTGVVKGKMTYMPPEQALGLEVDRRADLFSVGVMLWEAAAGQRMWKGLDDVVILGRLINGDVPCSPREVNPHVPKVLDQLCRRALAADPAERFENALEFQNELERFLETAGHQPTTREIGRYTTQLFEVDRRELKAIIEGQLSKIKDNAASSLEPVVIPDSLRGSASHPSHTETEISPNVELIQPVRADALMVPAVEKRPRSRTLSIVALTTAAAITALGALWFMRPDVLGLTAPAPGPTSTSVTESAPAVPLPSASTTEPAKVRITLRAVPATARFLIDDGPRLENPYVAEVTREDASHEVRVEAPGYESRTVVVTFDKNVLLELRLKKQTEAGALGRAPSPPPTGKLVPAPSQPKRPPREIFTDDPWK